MAGELRSHLMGAARASERLASQPLARTSISPANSSKHQPKCPQNAVSNLTVRSYYRPSGHNRHSRHKRPTGQPLRVSPSVTADGDRAAVAEHRAHEQRDENTRHEAVDVRE